jgi:hypothetical protein
MFLLVSFDFDTKKPLQVSHILDIHMSTQFGLTGLDHTSQISGNGHVIHIHSNNEDIITSISVEYSMFNLTTGEAYLHHNLLEQLIPLSSCLLQAVQHQSQLAHHVLFSRGFKTFWLMHVDGFGQGRIEVSTVDICLL